MKNVIVGQSGGPTAVINSSLLGVYKTALDRGADKVYGMVHGINGLLDREVVDLSARLNNAIDTYRGYRARKGRGLRGSRPHLFARSYVRPR